MANRSCLVLQIIMLLLVCLCLAIPLPRADSILGHSLEGIEPESRHKIIVSSPAALDHHFTRTDIERTINELQSRLSQGERELEFLNGTTPDRKIRGVAKLK